MSARRSLYEYPEFPPDLNQNDEDTDSNQSSEEISPGRVNSETHNSSKFRKNVKDGGSTTDQTYAFYFLGIVIAVITGILSVYVFEKFSKQDNTPVTSTKDWKQIVTELHPHLIEKGVKFPSQKEDVWYQIISGLKGLTDDPKKPAVYLLTYDEGSIHQSSCVAEIITTAANKYLLNKNGWGLLNGTSLMNSKIEDPGELIKAIADAADVNKIIVVTDVQHIPAKLARGFHFLVDEFNPKVGEAIYILTLKIPTYLKNNSPVKAAEETLKEAWKELNPDTLLPLVARMTVQVLPIMAENNRKHCPLKTSVTSEIYLS